MVCPVINVWKEPLSNIKQTHACVLQASSCLHMKKNAKNVSPIVTYAIILANVRGAESLSEWTSTVNVDLFIHKQVA